MVMERLANVSDETETTIGTMARWPVSHFEIVPSSALFENANQ